MEGHVKGREERGGGGVLGEEYKRCKSRSLFVLFCFCIFPFPFHHLPRLTISQISKEFTQTFESNDTSS